MTWEATVVVLIIFTAWDFETIDIDRLDPINARKVERWMRHALAGNPGNVERVARVLVGFDIVGMWEPSDGREKLFYLLRWNSADARERAWHAFRNDPDWIAVKAAAEAAGPIVSKMEFYLLHDAPFFPGKNA